MRHLLRHLLDASYLYAQNASPNGRWSLGQTGWGLAFVWGALFAWRWLRASRASGRAATAARVSLYACLMGAALLALRPLVTGALSARIWYLSAAGVALAAPLGHWLASRRWPTPIRQMARSLSIGLRPEDPPLPAAWQVVLGGAHAAGIAVLIVTGGFGGLALAVVALCLGAAWRGSARHRPDSPRRLRLDVLTPMLLPYASAVLRWGLTTGLGVDTAIYQAFPYPDPWSIWFEPHAMLLMGAGLALLNTGALLWRATPRPRVSLPGMVGLGMLLGALGWFAATSYVHRSHGASGSDPYSYLQMAHDLATRGTPLHSFTLADRARELGLPLWPAVHVGYHVPVGGAEAPTVWPIGWPVLLSAFYAVGGEGLALLAAPLWAMAAALVTGWLALSVWPDAPRGPRWLLAGIAAALILTSREVVLWSLVPMADAAAMALSALMMVCLVRARREDSLPWSAAAGAALAGAHFVRHTQLLLALAVPAAYLLGGPPRRWRHLGVATAAALLCALPDIAYRTHLFGAPWATESEEWFLISWRHIPTAWNMLLRHGLLRRGEFGYLLPLMAYGIRLGWRNPAERPWTRILWAGFLGVLLFSLCYSALRLRDLISLFPWLSLWAARGVVGIWRAAARPPTSHVRRAVAVLSLAALLAARTGPLIDAPWFERLHVFGHVSASQRAEYARLTDALPADAIIGTGLNSGAVERYTGRWTCRPAAWTDAEFARLGRSLAAAGHPIYLLDDGQEMEAFLARAGRLATLQRVDAFDLPTYGLGGQDYGRPAMLYRFVVPDDQ